MVGTQPSPWKLSLDAVVDYPRPGSDAPTQLAFSPDARYLTFLWSQRGDLVRDLWALDLETGERRRWLSAEELGVGRGELTPEEALRRERQRVREGGLTGYAWAARADRLLVPVNGHLYLISSPGQPPDAVAPADEPAGDAQITADGQRVVFLRARELWVADVVTGAVQQLTFDATEITANGVAEFVAQEEMGRHSGFWISPSGSHIAYTQVDESEIPPYPIVHQGSAEWRAEYHRYPFAGGPNARVRLGVVPIEGGVTRWLDLGSDPDHYLARLDWADEDRLVVQVESRDQHRLELRAHGLSSGMSEPLLVEESNVWVNLHNDLRFLDDGSFIWASERTGFKHLALHDPSGALARPLTGGAWPVDQVLHVDDAQGMVYFSAGREGPLERHVYSVSLQGGEPERLTEQPGWHGAVFARTGSCYAETFDSLTGAPSVMVQWLDRPKRLTVHRGGPIDELLPGLRAPELMEVPAGDGTVLYGAFYRPTVTPGPHLPPQPSPAPPRGGTHAFPLGWGEGAVFPPPRTGEGEGGGDAPPLIVSVYGGPHVQMVRNSWDLTADLRAQHLASLGFAVFKLDNRGSARRGLAFEGVIKGLLGAIEVQDQVAGVHWLARQGLVDPNRVGIYGWSYGGYMAAMCLLRAPGVFHVAAAGAPVADWDGYDTHYTERYLGTPATNGDGYRESSLVTHADRLQGKLLLIHGLIDENVHFRHTARFIAALEAAGRPFDLLLLPEERHGARQAPSGRPVRRYLEERLTSYLLENLG